MSRALWTIAILSGCLYAGLLLAGDTGSVEFLDSGKVIPSGLPLSEAVRVESLLYLSGQVGTVPGTVNLVSGGIKAEARQAMENIKASPGWAPPSPSGSETTRGNDASPERNSSQEKDGLIVLSTSTRPFVSAFNTNKDVPLFVAILSPTCGACRHGVEAIKETLSRDITAGTLRLLIVWAPMLDPDDEAAARQSASLFAGMPATQFYDPERLIGEAIRKEVFPRSADEMRQSLPSGHYLESTLKGRSNDIPEWDIYMFFAATTLWDPGAPRPAHWVRQLARVQAENGEFLSVMWKDSYTLPPTEGSLADQLKEMSAEMKSARRE